VAWGIPLGEALTNLGIMPDFLVTSQDSTNFLYIHKRNSEADLYFVVNQLSHPVDAQCQFRITGKSPELWDPVNGNAYRIPEYRNNKSSSNLSYRFAPGEAIFFVFRDEQNSDLEVLKTEIDREYEIKEFEGRVEFQPAYEESIAPAIITELKPLSEFEEDGIRYFAGKAHYTLNFTLPEDMNYSAPDWYLNIGRLDATAEVTLNDQNLGYVWSPNQELNVSTILKGMNRLEVTVATPYINRFKGDFIQFGEIRTLWTTAELDYIPETPLKKVGLMGPLMLFHYK
jgi:hypothetical protein